MTGVGPVVVLVGPPGAGKSTVGALLAQGMGVELVDTDALVEQRTGRTIPDIFVEDGEAAFRVLEHEAVRDALADSRGVVALGGGAVMHPGTQELLAGHRVVFLDVTIADAAGRVGFSQARPLLSVNPRARWTALMQERRGVYERVSTVRVDTGGRSAQDVADEVAQHLGRGSTA